LEPEEDDDEVVPELKSDHEFSPESDLELGPGEEIQPTRRARTVTAKRGRYTKPAKLFTLQENTVFRKSPEGKRS